MGLVGWTLITAAAFSIGGCNLFGGKEENPIERIELAGDITDALTIHANTEILVNDHLRFLAEGDSGLVFEGSARFLLDQGVNVLLPEDVIPPPTGLVEILPSGNHKWGYIKYDHPGKSLNLANFTISGGLTGLRLYGALDENIDVRLNQMEISDCDLYGIYCSRVDSLIALDLRITNCDVGAYFSECTVNLEYSDFRGCRIGIRNTQSSWLYLNDCRVMDNSEKGMFCTTYANTSADHVLFDGNYFGYYDHTNRYVSVTNSVFVNQSYYPVEFVRMWANYVTFEQNNIYPGALGRYVVLAEGSDQEGSGYLPIQDNYWGTTDTTVIVDGIVDGRTRANRGLVVFDPILQSPVPDAGPR